MKLGRSLLVGLALGLFAAPSIARAESPAVCAAAFEKGQILQRSLKLRDARAQYLFCSRPSCHTLVQKDCFDKLEEVSRDQPTITLAARDDDAKDVAPVRVFVDDSEIDASLAGAPVPVDPGRHTIRFIANGRTVTENVVVQAGQKNRSVVGTFARPSAVEPTPYHPPPATSAAPTTSAVFRADPEEPSGANRTPVYVLGGASALSFAGFAFFGLSGAAQRTSLAQTCKNDCTERQVSIVRERFLAADAFLIAGILTGGIAAYLYFTQPSAPARVATNRLAPRTSAR